MEKAPVELPPGSADEVNESAQFIERLEQQEKASRRRTILIIAAILLVGAAVIGAVLGISLTKSSSSSSATMKPATLTPSLSPSVIAPSAGKPTAGGPPVAAPVASPAYTPAYTPAASPALDESPTSSPASSSTTVPTSPPISTAPGTTPVALPTTVTPTTIAPTLDPTSAVFALLQSVALNGGAEFLNKTSYQSQSLATIELSDRNDDDWQVIQRYVLGCVYFATSGVMNGFSSSSETQWKNSTGWLSASEECTWYGITCNGDQRVVGINLAANNVTGTFPREVILLNETLTVFDIGSNNIFNEGDQVVFLGQLTNLVRLDIGSTYFTFFGLPPFLDRLTQLTYLDVSYTRMIGPMRAQRVFPPLRRLQHLQMGGLNFNLPIPSEIYNLPNLTHFYCDNSSITGSLDFILNMRSIQEIWMDRNPGLTGTIPIAIGNATKTLQSISLSECSLRGTIPFGMGNLVNLQQLWLSDNKLNGTIPYTLARLPEFINFDVSNNNLTGFLPPAMCNVTNVCVDCSEVKCCCCSCCNSSTCAASG